MPKKKKNTLNILAIFFASVSISASLVFLGFQIGKSSITTTAPQAKQPILQDPKLAFIPNISAQKDHIYGNKNAQITLIEYSDTSCGYCRRFHPIAEAIVEHYQGKVNWVYRHKLLYTDDEFSEDKAIISECVAKHSGNDAFWKFIDDLFISNTKNLDGLIAQVEDFGLSAQDVYQCLSESQLRSQVVGSTTDSMLAGINGTPGNVLIDNVTGARVSVHGAQPQENFIRIIDRMLQNNATSS